MNIKFFIPLSFIFLIKIINIDNKQEKQSLAGEEENENDSGITYDLKKFVKFNCTDSDIDCSGNGKCSEDGLKCECLTGYQTFYENYEDYLMNKPRCNYKSKYQIKALLFSLFISFGSAHFYVGHTVIGLIQFCFFTFVFCFNSIFAAKLSIKHIKKLNRDELKKSFNIIVIMILSLFLFFFWYLFDLIMFYMNIYKDSNNAKLYSY